MTITRTQKIVGALLVATGAGFVAWKYFVCPELKIYSLNPMDGSGQFRFGQAVGNIATGGFDGGWGWTLSFAAFQPGAGWTIQVNKGGAIRKTMVINSVGTTKVV